MGKTLRVSRILGTTVEKGSNEDPGGRSLVLMAFSDYGGRDISSLLDFAKHLTQPPDLLLYGGDSADSPAKLSIHQLRQLAACTKYKICAIAGRATTLDPKARKKPAVIRADRRGVGGRGRSGEVHNLRQTPIVVGKYAVLGGAAIAGRNGGPEPAALAVEERRERSITAALAGRHLIVLSHDLPENALELKPSSGRSPTSVLRQFLLNRRKVPLVVCGDAGCRGGESRKMGHSVVVNVASDADLAQPGRVGLIEMRCGKVVRVKWTTHWDLASIPGVNEERKASLERAGVHTPRELAESSSAYIAQAIRAGSTETARLQAQALAFYRHDIIPLRGLSLPQTKRAYLTFESCGARDDIQVVGLHSQGEERTSILVADTPENEKHILSELLRLLEPASGLNLVCYSGSLWHQQLLSRRLAWHGLSTRITRSITDIFFEIEDCFAFPTRPLGLKQVAECCGFKWHDSLTAEYSTARLCATSEGLSRAQKQELIRRSEENLRALRYIVMHLEQIYPLRTSAIQETPLSGERNWVLAPGDQDTHTS